MRVDAANLLEFYRTPLGQVTRRLLAHRIRSRWRNCRGGTLMGLGFAVPYLAAYRHEAARTGALMPLEQGAVVWPPAGRTLSVLVDEERLPLAGNSVDRLLVIHCLEMSERAGALLREIWRVLAPEGRVLLIVPNRRGLWARLDSTPFGHGRPYSRTQLETLLCDALFTPLEWGAALYMPPVNSPLVLRSAAAWERLGARLPPAFAGVILVEAQKEVLSPISSAVPAASRRVWVHG